MDQSVAAWTRCWGWWSPFTRLQGQTEISRRGEAAELPAKPPGKTAASPVSACVRQKAPQHAAGESYCVILEKIEKLIHIKYTEK